MMALEGSSSSTTEYHSFSSTEQTVPSSNQAATDTGIDNAMGAKLRHGDSFKLKAGRVSTARGHISRVDWKRTLSLAFQSIGVVYGDIGTSPLYVFSSTFTDHKIEKKDDIIGVLSLSIYTMALVPLLKYVLIVLRANDNGNGGTFALYSLIRRYARVGLIPNDQPEDRQLPNSRLDTPSDQLGRAQKVKEKLENSKTSKIVLFLVTILGTSMVIGDGVLTPCISVLSAVSGISCLGKDGTVGISVAILIALFSVQRFGTDRVGFFFAPIILLWLTFITGIGLYNLFKYNPGVLRAFNPKYIVDYFRRNGKKGWISLGGVVLCITGTEAMFADLGHFNVPAIQISFSSIVFPALLAAYSGQAAYLTEFPGGVEHLFYNSIPDPLYWPTFVVAVAAAIIASQAMISGAFSIISQSLTLGCFPRVKVVHTSAQYEGQVYIPEINYVLMITCIIVCISFKTTERIGNAYGIAVVAVMVITTWMVSLIMLVVWRTSTRWIALFSVVFGCIEAVYVSAVLYKFKEGGFLPVAFSFVLMAVMGVWHYVHKERYLFELRNKVSDDYMKDLAANPHINRVPGIGLLFSELVQGIPPIFAHFIANVYCIHSVLVFVSIKYIPISRVALGERFLFQYVEPRDYRIFRCVVRYGYKDVVEGAMEFEEQLVEHLKEFIWHEISYISEAMAVEQSEQMAEPLLLNPQHSAMLVNDGEAAISGPSSTVHEVESGQQNLPRVSSGSIHMDIESTNSSTGMVTGLPIQGAEEEMQIVQTAKEKGVVYLLGEAELVAGENSSLFKQIIVNYAYSFLRKNFRQGEKVLEIPRARLLRVGMAYEI